MTQSNFEIVRGQRHHCQRGERLWGLLQSNHALDRVRPASTVWLAYPDRPLSSPTLRPSILHKRTSRGLDRTGQDAVELTSPSE
jgi:hypothetical protein